MKQHYLQLADAYDNLAGIYRNLANNIPDEGPALASPNEEPQAAPKPAVTLEMVRALLAQKNQEGKKEQVKALLHKYDSGKLSGVNPEDYPALPADAEAL